jgi:hypothetical protein
MGLRQDAGDERLLDAVRGFLVDLELLPGVEQKHESTLLAKGGGGAAPAPPRPRSRCIGTSN